MSPVLIVGLLISLFAMSIVIEVFRFIQTDKAVKLPRLIFWILAVVVLFLAIHEDPSYLTQIGLGTINLGNIAIGLGTGLIVVLLWPVLQKLQVILGGTKTEGSEQFQNLISLSRSDRVFLVVTAGFVEEIFFRGYAIGIGQEIFGSLWIALSVSSICFTMGHFRWGKSHLITVFLVGVFLSTLFIYTQDLLSCILAHTLIDFIGFLLVPELLSKHNEMKLKTP